MKNNTLIQEKVKTKDISTFFNWDEKKIKFFISPEKSVRAFLKKQNLGLKMKDNNRFSGWVDEKVKGWDYERKEHREEILERVKLNMVETRTIQIEKFLQDERQVSEQLFDAVKEKIANSFAGVKDSQIKNKLTTKLTIKELKVLSETVVNLVKVGRQRLGLPFGKDEEIMDKSIKQFNFDFVNLDEFEPEQLANFFKKKDEQQKYTKSIETDSISEISRFVKRN